MENEKFELNNEQIPAFEGDSAEMVKEYNEWLDNGGFEELMDEWLLEDQIRAELENFNEHEQ